VDDDDRVIVDARTRYEGMTRWTGSRRADSLRAEERAEKNLGSQVERVCTGPRIPTKRTFKDLDGSTLRHRGCRSFGPPESKPEYSQEKARRRGKARFGKEQPEMKM
jgi:hypothetical protein